MKTLASIQKTYNVFKTLAKIAMILSFILAGTLLLGVLGAALILRHGAELRERPQQ